MPGKVIIAGAGIGSPENITVRAMRAVNEADVIIYDRLLNDAIIPEDSGKELYYAGKTAGNHYLKQDEINELMVKKAMEGKNVLRLKGGDPYVFGRGGEEALYCLEHGIDAEVIPGVTSGTAALMYSGIPATHRDLAESVSFITGNRKEGETSSYEKYAGLNGTLVFYMGLNNLPKITEDLIRGGMDKDMPAAVIMKGGYPDNRTVTGTIENISEAAKREGLGSPAIIVVGKVVSLRDSLDFMKNKPLYKTTVAVTCASGTPSELGRILREEGASVKEIPSFSIRKKITPKTAEVIREMGKEGYTHLIFHSVNAVNIFMEEFLKINDIRELSGIKIAVTGIKTAKALKKFGIRADIIPGKYQGENIAELIENRNCLVKILLPHSDLTRKNLIEEYRKKGEVKDFVIYETIKPNTLNETDTNAQYTVFTSSSAVRNFTEIYGKKRLKNTRVIAIGDITGEELRKNNIEIYGKPESATFESIKDFIAEDIKE